MNISKELWSRLVPEWSESAACIGQWDIFDSDIESIMGLDDIPLGMSVELYAAMTERNRRNTVALNICWTQCTVRQECLKAALEQGLEDTIRGGYTQAEREIMLQDYESGQHDQY